MASFRFNNASAPTNNTTSNDAWKSAAFINCYLPGGEGKPTKFGAIGLRPANADEKELLDFAKKDPDAFIKWLAANITFDFREVREGGGRFAIPTEAKK